MAMQNTALWTMLCVYAVAIFLAIATPILIVVALVKFIFFGGF